jgi:two-component system, cell cycle response regulator
MVRLAVLVQQAAQRAAGTALAGAFGALLLYAAEHDIEGALLVASMVAFAVSLAHRAHRRLRRLSARETARLDLDLFVHLTVLVYGAVILVGGGVGGPLYPAVYALVMLAAAFARPFAVAGTVSFAIALETAHVVGLGGGSLSDILPHAALMLAFACLNLFVFRAEIARVRRLSRRRLEGELERMRDDARSYRLIGAPTSAVASIPEPSQLGFTGDSERMLRSSVEEIQATLAFSLDLLRRTLGLHSAALLWLTAKGERLTLRELSTSDSSIDRGPFRAGAGLFGAALGNRSVVTLEGSRARQQVPFHVGESIVESVAAVPILEHRQPRGLLVATRTHPVPFSPDETELLEGVTRFALRVIENERVFVQLERAKNEQGKLYRAVNQLAAATTEAEVIEAGVSCARDFATFDFAAVTLFAKSGKGAVHEICAGSGEGAAELVGQRFRHNGGLVSMVVANKHPLPYRGDFDPAHQMVFARRVDPPNMASLVVLPLLVHDTVLGTLILGSKTRGAFGDAVRPTLEVLSRHIAVSLANARMVKRLEDLATTDGMTGHYNKRALVEVARQKIRSAERFKKPLALLVCDIDHFKRVNDDFGHDVGDVVIKGFGEVLRRTKRDTDAVGRFGGEEFVLVCEETDAAGAELLADRIRKELETTTFHTEQGPLNVTCSVGVATFPEAGLDWEKLFKATDEALYVSKRAGRNRSTVWAPRLRGSSGQAA